MPTAARGEYEVVLENRQLTLIFFAVVVLCAVFFALGYIVGKNTMGYIPPAEAGVTAVPGEKNTTAPAGVADPGKAQAATSPPAAELTFQRALETKGSPAKLQTRSSATIPVRAATGPAVHLQVAALSKKQDAEALLSLLRGKGFPVVLVSSQADRLYRVQVGPLGSAKEVEQTKRRLQREGFKTITKK